jgi:hypothetical protein
MKPFLITFRIDKGTLQQWTRFAENIEAARESARAALEREYPAACFVMLEVQPVSYLTTLYLTVAPSGTVEALYRTGDHPRELPHDIGMKVGTWGEILTFLHSDPLCRIIVRAACPRCGSMKLSDQSCGCFDNGGQ